MRSRAGWLLAAAIVALPGISRAEETPADDAPQLLATEAAGVYPIDDERRVSVRGVTGDLLIRLGKAKEIRFLSVKAGTKKEEIPLAIWLDGTTLILAPPEGQPPAPRTLELAVGPGIQIEVEAERSLVRVGGSQGAVTISGRALTVETRGIKGGLTLDLAESKAVVESTDGDVKLRGREIDAKFTSIAGDFDADVVGGTLSVVSVRGVRIESDRTAVTFDGVQGPIRADATAGSLALLKAKRGGELKLSGAPVKIEGAEGDFTISTDADVEFRDGKASIHIDSYGGSVRGGKNEGLVEVRTRNAEVALSALIGPARVQGDGLRVQIEEIVGELYVDATSSEVTILRPNQKVEVDADRGDVTIQGSEGPVDVRSRSGNVRVVEARGAVNVQADGDSVEAGWAAIDGKGDSTIANASGSVSLRFPQGYPYRLEARSRGGRVESGIDRVVAAPDGQSAVGPMGAGGRPLVRVEAEGDIMILGSDAPSAPAAPTEPEEPEEPEEPKD